MWPWPRKLHYQLPHTSLDSGERADANCTEQSAWPGAGTQHTAVPSRHTAKASQRLKPSPRLLVVAQLPTHVWLFVTPWTAACQASLSLTISRSFPKFMFTASVMPSNHVILWCSCLLLPSIFPSIRDFPNESSVCIRWIKYWSFSVSVSLSSE